MYFDYTLRSYTFSLAIDVSLFVSFHYLFVLLPNLLISFFFYGAHLSTAHAIDFYYLMPAYFNHFMSYDTTSLSPLPLLFHL